MSLNLSFFYKIHKRCILRYENKVSSELTTQKCGAFFYKCKKRKLSPGSIVEEQFWMLAEISPLHSEKVIRALYDFLVLGYSRREACNKYNVSLSYFSIALGRMSHVNYIVSLLMLYYDNGC
ncbi:TPA: transcriptional regulator [Escherichia coli]|nr:transcriptional regulator [Escherichia coli]MBS9193130.1 transcriptional regulator [Escherichia coli]HBA3546435.1 transcriptional regulator [Escherichia coli]HEI4996682.1 transcriptional regulator [Escherichia coli]